MRFRWQAVGALHQRSRTSYMMKLEASEKMLVALAPHSKR